MLSAVIYFRSLASSGSRVNPSVARLMWPPLLDTTSAQCTLNTIKEITMPHDRPYVSPKPHLDDLLAMIGLTREQLTEMTAEDLFAAATRWQQTTRIMLPRCNVLGPPSIASSIPAQAIGGGLPKRQHPNMDPRDRKFPSVRNQGTCR